MDFALNEDQLAILDAVEKVLEQLAGPDRAVALNVTDGYDSELEAALADAGFLSIMRDLQKEDGTLAGLESALVLEAICRAGGVMSSGALLLVAPGLMTQTLPGPIAVCTQSELEQQTPVRYLTQAQSLIVIDDLPTESNRTDSDDVTIYDLAQTQREAVRSSFGYPMGKLASAGLPTQSITLQDAAPIARRWWRTSLAVEAVGTMEAALTCVVDYLKQRRQFGRAIGSFQAVQHRLSECAIHIEASRWLAREAAYHNAPEEACAVAAGYALDSADRVFSETHQLSGAIGFTRDFNLHVWSMRLLALRQELGGVSGARRALVRARWAEKAAC